MGNVQKTSNKLAARSKIATFEESLLKLADGDLIEGDGKEIVHSNKFPMKHAFADGIYVREMLMNKDSAVVGAIHKHLHVWFLLTGHLVVVTEDFKEEYIAPCYVVAKPGSKRLIYAVEESRFVNIHKNPDNTQDLKELEKNIVAMNYKEYEDYINKNK
tara:strand:- start:85 stop:561 length:477 start_codon:yes stop_codon:yes gene_type:complete